VKKKQKQQPEPRPAPEIPDVSETPLRNTKLSALIVEHANLSSRIKAAKERQSAVSASIEALLLKAGLSKIMHGRLEAARIESHNSGISKQKLLDQGVPLKQILKAEWRTDYSYVKVEDVDERKNKKQEAATVRKAS
jgi:hypothetical protein